MKTPKNESILSGLLAKNPVWNEISGGDTAELANSIETGEWIGLMTGAEDDTDAGWDKYIADTFGPFADFVEGRYIKPDESEPDFRVAQVKFKPLFNRLSTNAKTGLLADLGDALKDGYFAESKTKSEGRPKATDGRVHQFVFDFVITGNDTLSDVEDRIRNEIDLIDGIAKVSNGDSETSWPEAEYFGEGKTSEAGLSPKLAQRAKAKEKIKEYDALCANLRGFKEIGMAFSDFNTPSVQDAYMVPVYGMPTEKDAQKYADDLFGGLKKYLDYNVEFDEMGGPHGEPVWSPVIKFKPSIFDLDSAEAKDAFTKISDAIYRGVCGEAPDAAKPMMQRSTRISELGKLFNAHTGFQKWGPDFEDVFDSHMAIPVGYNTEEEAKKASAAKFADFDDYVDYSPTLIPEGGPKGEDMWFPALKFKDAILELNDKDANYVFGELSDIVAEMLKADKKGKREELSPKLALRSKLTRVDNHLKGLYVFNSVIGRSAKELHDKGFDLDMGCGDKADCETEAKKALSDFDDYVEYNIVSEMENGKPYWYVDIKFKPEFWELGDAELGEVLTLLNGAIEEYA